MHIEPLTFQLEGFEDSVEVELTDSINKDQLLQFPAFRDWVLTLRTNLDLQRTNTDHTFASDPYKLSKVKILSVYWFRPINKIGFVKLEASIYNSKGKLPGVAFLRGGSVAMLMILRPRDSRDERWVVMTEQPRIPAGSLRFVEIPAGMIDEATNDFAGKAAAEIFEETGFKLPKDELINLTELALKASVGEGGEKLENAMYPSPGGSDEYISIFL